MAVGGSGHAKDLVYRAVKSGRLVRGPCEKRGEDCKGRIEAHHDDYSKPLDVRWLCNFHHNMERRGANGLGDIFQFRLSRERKAKWRAAADEAGYKSLAEFIRDVVDAHVAGQSRPPVVSAAARSSPGPGALVTSPTREAPPQAVVGDLAGPAKSQFKPERKR